MRLEATEHFGRDYERLPQRVQQRVDNALGLLLENPSHPWLQIKKIKGYENRWEGRVTHHYRFTFTVEGGTYTLLRVGTHDLLK